MATQEGAKTHRMFAGMIRQDVLEEKIEAKGWTVAYLCELIDRTEEQVQEAIFGEHRRYETNIDIPTGALLDVALNVPHDKIMNAIQRDAYLDYATQMSFARGFVVPRVYGRKPIEPPPGLILK